MVVLSQQKQFILEGTGGQFEFAIGEGRWSDCWLKTDKRTFLGSEDAVRLIELLLSRVVEDNGSNAGEINGLPVKWVLSLCGVYSRLYAGYENNERILFCLTLQGALLAAIRLGPSELAQWRFVLESQLKKL
jgi:hypothetical protein